MNKKKNLLLDFNIIFPKVRPDDPFIFNFFLYLHKGQQSLLRDKKKKYWQHAS